MIDLPDLPETFAAEVFEALAAAFAAFAACLERLARRVPGLGWPGRCFWAVSHVDGEISCFLQRRK